MVISRLRTLLVATVLMIACEITCRALERQYVRGCQEEFRTLPAAASGQMQLSECRLPPWPAVLAALGAALYLTAACMLLSAARRPNARADWTWRLCALAVVSTTPFALTDLLGLVQSALRSL
jgi:hypothetical protein